MGNDVIRERTSCASWMERGADGATERCSLACSKEGRPLASGTALARIVVDGMQRQSGGSRAAVSYGPAALPNQAERVCPAIGLGHPHVVAPAVKDHDLHYSRIDPYSRDVEHRRRVERVERVRGAGHRLGARHPDAGA